MINFTPNHRFIYCWHCPLRGQNPHFFRVNVNVENHRNVSLDVDSDESVFFEPWEMELRSGGGFMFGDPLCHRNGISFVCLGSFVFVLNKQSILSTPRSDSVEMLSPDIFAKGSDGISHVVHYLVFSVNGETIYQVSEVAVPIADGQLEKSLTVLDVTSGELVGENNTVVGGAEQE